jgi:hypothetical protein
MVDTRWDNNMGAHCELNVEDVVGVKAMDAPEEVGVKGVVSAVDPETLLWRPQPLLLPL